MTASCVVRWADNYRSVLPDYYVGFHLVQPGSVREGPLPASLHARHSFLEELFAEAEKTHAPGSLGLTLKHGDRYVQIQDGLLPLLVLTPDQFAEFQDCLAAHNLPRDLYYPASEQQEFVEPVALNGGIVRMRQRYTPKRAELRWSLKAAKIRIPTEKQRERTFLAASQRYLNALRLRIAELHEPGRVVDKAEIEQLDQLLVRILEQVVRSSQLC